MKMYATCLTCVPGVLLTYYLQAGCAIKRSRSACVFYPVKSQLILRFTLHLKTCSVSENRTATHTHRTLRIEKNLIW